MTGPPPSDRGASHGGFERLDSVITGGGECMNRGDRSVVTVTSDFGLSIEEGSWRLEADLSKAIGGTESAPTPGMFGRAALGSWLGLGYQLCAAGMDIELILVRVEVETDTAGTRSTPSTIQSGYAGSRYHVMIESSARADRVQAVIDQADRLGPCRSGFASATFGRTISINRPSK